MILKIDQMKAYDQLEWSFLESSLQAWGFLESVTNFILSCVNSMSYKLLLNESTTKSFSPSCGIRQGDPIYLLLFIILQKCLQD